MAAMEDVLDLYEEEYDPQYPTVCFDEKPISLVADVLPSHVLAPGIPARSDYEYQRNGTRNAFFFVEPLAGWRHVQVTLQRTKQDYARCMQWLVDEAYPDAAYIRVVQDNLSTHTPAALYDTFAPAEARRILRRLEFHFTPKHGSWLNMAEIEIGIFARGCLSHRVGDEATLLHRLQALETARNTKRLTITWCFTSQDARAKLHRLYPTMQT